MTRLLDVLVASLILIVTAPVLLVITFLSRCDSPGPIIYGSPRVGRNGKAFRLLRFRTVDLSKPAHLSMQERLSRVGSFIRNYSLDDLPNAFNVLKGKLSLVGPRPTEPELVDLNDPAWQKVLTVRPGYISWAILELASAYNASPWSLKLQLEEEYIQKKSLVFDVLVLRKAVRGLIASRGNIKARGGSLGSGRRELDGQQGEVLRIQRQFHIINVQRRMGDWYFETAKRWEDLVAVHEKWVLDYTYQRHLAHEKREDGRHSPAEVLGWITGKQYEPDYRYRAFSALGVTRTHAIGWLCSLSRLLALWRAKFGRRKSAYQCVSRNAGGGI